jgi:hypothetical protein
MSKDFRLVTAIRIEDDTSIWVTDDDGSPPAPNPDEVVLAPGLYYVSGDSSATDLMKYLSGALFSAGYPDCVFSVDQSTGLVSMKRTGATIDIDWTDAGSVGRSAEYVRDALRLDAFGDNPTLNSTPKVATRVHLGGFYPTYYLIDDLTNREPQASILIPDTGNAQVIYVADRKRFDLQVRTDGYPRTAGFTEYHDLEAWWQHAITGVPTRLYPDVTIDDAYSTSQRYGYQTMTIIPDDFDPQPEDANWYRHHTYSFRGVEYTE